jgi:hypothetical protein
MDNTYHKYNSSLVSYLAKDNFRILGMISVLKDITGEYLEHRANFIESKALTILSELADCLHAEISKKVTIEQEVLFMEIERQLSKICSTDQLREDHIKISALSSYIRIIMNKKVYSEYKDHNINTYINFLYNAYKKYTYKHSEILYYEMETFLTKDELQKIYFKLIP